MSYQDASRAVEDYITILFQLHQDEKLFYHNLEHTRKVVARAEEIALVYTLDDESVFIIKTAAWFHDAGYLFVGSNGHELKGVDLMKEFILGMSSGRRLAEKISQCIMATKRVAEPVSLMEKIICDADTYHFGTLEFRQTDLLIKKEIEFLTGSVQTGWISDTIRMLKSHQFYTSYCKELLNAGKEQNIEWLKSRL
jgi:predicted metal-dependent HD superfamily phosphohydrolase